MSAAVMTSTVYDFGDTLLKNNSGAGRSARGVRWGGHGEGVAGVAGVASPAEYQREGLSRRASNPVQQQPHHHGLTLNMAQLVIQLDSAMPSAPSTPSSATPSTPGGCAAGAAHRKLDRSHSEPANPSAACKASAGSAAANINTSRYKTELCRPFEESGSCKYGDKCQFAHGAHELRTLARHPKYKTELCRTYHTIGLCPYGPRCHFVHNDEESLANGSPPQGPAHGQAHGPAAKPPPALSALPALPALPRPKALTLATTPVPAPVYLAGSTADSPSPTSSLSQSPTNSHRSFFMSSEDVFGSVSPTPSSAAANTAFSFGPDFATLVHGTPVSAPSSVSSRDSPSPPGSPFRLPIFNHLSNQVMKIRLDV